MDEILKEVLAKKVRNTLASMLIDFADRNEISEVDVAEILVENASKVADYLISGGEL